MKQCLKSLPLYTGGSGNLGLEVVRMQAFFGVLVFGLFDFMMSVGT